MTAHDDYDVEEFHLPPPDTLEVDKKGMEDVLKTVMSLSTKVAKRVAKDVKDKQQQQRDTAALVAEADAVAAADDEEHTAQQEQKIQHKMQMVQDTLQEDEAAVQPEPEVYEVTIKGVQGSDELAVCPSEACAAAAFQAVCRGPPALAAAAYRRWLSWCGAGEVRTGVGCMTLVEGDIVDLAMATEGQEQQKGQQQENKSSTSMWCLANQQPTVTIGWLPTDVDLLEAFTALGYLRDGSKGSSKKQPAAAADELLPLACDNIKMLLQLITQLCRLGAAGKLPVQLGCGGHGQQLAVLLLRLQLDNRVVTSCKRAADEAFAAFLEAPGATDWSRMVPVLLEALSGGIGPSHRRMLKGLVMPSSSSGGGSRPEADVHDYWRLLHIVDAANLLLWVEVVKPGSAGLDAKVRSWFVNWMEKLEHELVKKLQSHRVRSRLTELINMYTFAEQLVHCRQAAAAGGVGGAFGDAGVVIDDDDDLA
eukprot:gene2481-2785_t